MQEFAPQDTCQHGGTFWVVTKWKDTPGTEWVEARNADGHSTGHRMPSLCPKNDLSPNVNQSTKPGCFNIFSEIQTQTATLHWCWGGREGLESAQLSEDWFQEEGLAESQVGRQEPPGN